MGNSHCTHSADIEGKTSERLLPGPNPGLWGMLHEGLPGGEASELSTI